MVYHSAFDDEEYIIRIYAVTCAIINNQFPYLFCLGVNTQASRTFAINHTTNKFEMDGKDFQYVSGSFHYFRAVAEAWDERLKVMRAAGLNALDTYVEWSLHNPLENVYDFKGMADVEGFLELAQQNGFYVILRPGPYICAERDNVSNNNFEFIFKDSL